MKIKRIAFLLSSIILFGYMLSCSSSPTNSDNNGVGNDTLAILFPPYGVDSLVEVVTWNVKYSQQQYFSEEKEKKVAEIILSLDVDIVAVQEFPSGAQMNRILEKLDGYGGIVNPDEVSYYQNTAYFYKKSTVTLVDSDPIFVGETYPFPRSPFTADFLVESTYGDLELHVVNLHLKAYSDSTSNARRKIANDSLESYIGSYMTSTLMDGAVVLGDYNDTIDDSLVFGAWYQHPDAFMFSTKDIHEDESQASYPSWPSFIDHLLLTRSLYDNEEPYLHSETETILLDNHIVNYDDISDHRPVMSKFKFIKE